MARTLYLLDGSSEVLFCGDDPEKQAAELERILRERLGDDAATLLHEILDPEQNGRADLEWELKNYESSCDSYRSTLQDVQEDLQTISKLVGGDRLNRKKIADTVSALITKINNEL